jgi:hypothetical protein
MAGRYEADFFFDGSLVEPIELVVEVARNTDYLATAYVTLPPGIDRYHFAVPFTAEGDNDFYEFRVRNCVSHPVCMLSFRGVELRYGRVTEE